MSPEFLLFRVLLRRCDYCLHVFGIFAQKGPWRGRKNHPVLKSSLMVAWRLGGLTSLFKLLRVETERTRQGKNLYGFGRYLLGCVCVCVQILPSHKYFLVFFGFPFCFLVLLVSLCFVYFSLVVLSSSLFPALLMVARKALKFESLSKRALAWCMDQI